MNSEWLNGVKSADGGGGGRGSRVKGGGWRVKGVKGEGVSGETWSEYHVVSKEDAWADWTPSWILWQLLYYWQANNNNELMISITHDHALMIDGLTLLTTHYSLLTAHYSLLTAHCWLAGHRIFSCTTISWEDKDKNPLRFPLKCSSTLACYLLCSDTCY